MPELAPGAVFAGHRIEGVAGRGGMGVVYRATHLALDHVVALKVISAELADDERFRERFKSESRIAVSLRHPNVVQIHHAGEEDGLLFVTMDLVEGTDLRGMLNREARLEPGRAIRIVSEVAAALDVAHARGLVHRDVKPGNVLLEGATGGEHVYLTDFGLAKRIEASTGATATGAFVGTLDYVAPEQIRGERVDARTDVYALGCVLYEALAGRVPFARREEKVAKIYAHLQEKPSALERVAPEVPSELGPVVARALEKDPNRRFPSAGDLARAAGAALTGVAVSEPERSVGTGAAAPTEPLPSTVETARARPRRRFPALALGLAGLAVALAAAVVLLGGDDGGSGETARATVQGQPIPLDGRPSAVAPAADGAWVGAPKDDLVFRVDSEGEPSEPFNGIDQPEGMVEAFDSLWVASRADDQLIELDPETGEVRDRIGVGEEPTSVIATSDHLWVAATEGDQVARIDPDTDAVQTVPVPGAPFGLAAGEEIWVTQREAGTVSRIEPDSVELAGTTPVGEDPKGIAIAEETAWVANAADGDVTPIDLDTRQRQDPIEVGLTPRHVAAGFGSVWVANGGSGTVSQIDPRAARVVDDPLEVGAGPQGIAVGERFVFVANNDDSSVSLIAP
jgi:streptogramin lyase